METFSIEFKVGNLELDAIVTAYDHHRRFKVELVTNEQDPIILGRSPEGEWVVERAGKRTISAKGFQDLQRAIDDYMDRIYALWNILILTDFSDTAINAARYAAAVATRFKSSSIILYHSLVLPLSSDIPLNAAELLKYQQDVLAQLDRHKAELQELVPEGVHIITRTDERGLAPAVNMIAEQQRVGLVVMGTTGKNALERTLTGSNTITVARECKVPLLVVPAQAVFENIENVLFACDLKKVSEITPIRSIKTLIHRLGAKLFVLHVAKEGARFDPDMLNELTALHRLLDDEQPEYHYTDHDDLITGIMDFASEQHIQLLFTVPKEYGFFEGLFHRSLTEKLAYHTHLPLLLFREDK